MGDRYRGGRKIERIMLKYSFSRFKNTASDPILIDLDDTSEEATVENKNEEQDNGNEADNMILDILSPDDPPTLETVPSIITQSNTDEVVEGLMKELSMADDIKQSTTSRDVNRSDAVFGKNKGKSPMSDEKIAKKLKSEPSVHATNPGKSPMSDEKKAKKLKSEPSVNDTSPAVEPAPVRKYTILIESTSRCTRSSSRLQQMTPGTSCKGKSPSSPSEDELINSKTKVKVEGDGADASVVKKAKHEKDSQQKPSKTGSSGSRKRVHKFGNLKTRTSPKTLYKTISGLNTAQKEALKDIGLKSFIDMRLDGVPSKLGFFVVDRTEITCSRRKLLQNKHGLIWINLLHRLVYIQKLVIELTYTH